MTFFLSLTLSFFITTATTITTTTTVVLMQIFHFEASKLAKFDKKINCFAADVLLLNVSLTAHLCLFCYQYSKDK